MGVARLFDDNIGREVRDGTHTLFWWDMWLKCFLLGGGGRRDVEVTRKLFAWEES